MNVSDEKLAEFSKLFEEKTGQKLPEEDKLARTSALLGMMAILYKPVKMSDYIRAIVKKLSFKKFGRID